MTILQHNLLTEEHARLFVEEFTRETVRLARGDDYHDETARRRLREVETQLGNLYQNLLGGLATPILRTMIEERETEKACLEARVHEFARPIAAILPYRALLDLSAQKTRALPQTLDYAFVRTEAAQVLSTLIKSVTIQIDGEYRPEAEVVAKVSELVAYATNDNAAPEGGASYPIVVVAGTGFEPVTFRL